MKYILVFLFFITSLFASIGEITAIYGKAYAIRGGKSIALFKGSKLEKQDIIKTMPNSRLQIVFVDHTVISLGQKTTFRVDKYDFNRQNQEARFSVSRGIFKSITGKIGHLNHSKYTLKTNNATIGVRGTIYVGRIESTKESIACTSGEIVVYTKRGSVVVKRGEITTFTSFTAPSKPKKLKEESLKLFEDVVEKSDLSAVENNNEKLVFSTNTSTFQKDKKSSQKYDITLSSSSEKDFINKIKKEKKDENVEYKIVNVGDYLKKSNKLKDVKAQVAIVKNRENSHNSVEKIVKINIPKKEDFIKVRHELKEMFGDFAKKDFSKAQTDQEYKINDYKKSEFDKLIKRAGSSRLHYVGRVRGQDIIQDRNNKIDLNFDLGKASVNGRVNFDKRRSFFGKSINLNYNTRLKGRVDPTGKFAFRAVTSNYTGGGRGELRGEHLQKAEGSLNLSKTFMGLKVDSTKATFSANRK